MFEPCYNEAAKVIRNAQVLIITAGAGMGVDSGLPDFRGDQGFWNAYPMYAQLGLTFVQAANPHHFEDDPKFGWGFYGHRTNLYRDTIPHQGFGILKKWIAQFSLDNFVVTSNVDGQFQKAGFITERILEVHGSIHHLQCTIPCRNTIWENNAQFTIDETTMRSHAVPICPNCNNVARPNILMFGDYGWVSRRTAIQEESFSDFIQPLKDKKIVIIEMGAGSAIPTIRNLTEKLGRYPQATVIRINPREPQIRAPHLSFSEGAVATLKLIDDEL